MSTALTVKTAAGTPLDKLFDFEASHAKATARLRKALDGNGAEASDLVTLKRWECMEGVVVALNVVTGWSSSGRTHAGKIQGNIRYVSDAGLEAAYRQHFDAYIRRPEHVEAVVARLTASPAVGFGAHKKIELGGIPLAFASECDCGGCSGRGQVACTYCLYGKDTCRSCNGNQRIWTGSSWMACNNCWRGQVNCSWCAGSHRIACGGCGGKGFFTTVWTGSIHADIECGITTPQGNDEKWTKSLTKSGHAWLAEAGFVEKPHVARGEGTAQIAWAVRIPVMGQTFRIGDKEYNAQYVGLYERMWSLPYFLDDCLKEVEHMIGFKTGDANAFALAARYPVFAEVRRGVLEEPRADKAVAAMFENAISEGVLLMVRTGLEQARDKIARSTILTTWKYGGVAITVGSLIALASGQFRTMFGVVLPGAQEATDQSVAIFGGLVLVALLAAMWFFAGLAGRSAVRTALKSNAKRLPAQGRAPACACLAAILAYSVGAYAMIPKPERASTRTAKISVASDVLTVKAATASNSRR